MTSLQPYQFQLGDVVFGRNTKYPVSGVQIASYNVNNQDFQVARSNETRMGIDTEQPGAITFAIGVLDDAPLNNVPGRGVFDSQLISDSAPRLTALQKAWKATDYAQSYGALTYITYCDGYGSTRRIYGRPRKFQYTRKSPKSAFYKVTAEFARADTLTHDDAEQSLILSTTPKSLTRSGGDADSWLRIQLTGPMTIVTVTVGAWSASIDMTDLPLPAGHVMELSSYPWDRSIVDLTNGFNYRGALTGNSPYLDQMSIPPAQAVTVSYTAAGQSGGSGAVLWWRDAYHTV